MYRLIKSIISQQIVAVLRTADNTFIPLDPDNTDYQTYLKWVAEGNTPESAE